jgi:hypothetical protein
LAVEFEQLIDNTITAELAIEQRAIAMAQRCSVPNCTGKLKMNVKAMKELR